MQCDHWQDLASICRCTQVVPINLPVGQRWLPSQIALSHLRLQLRSSRHSVFSAHRHGLREQVQRPGLLRQSAQPERAVQVHVLVRPSPVALPLPPTEPRQRRSGTFAARPLRCTGIQLLFTILSSLHYVRAGHHRFSSTCSACTSPSAEPSSPPRQVSMSASPPADCWAAGWPSPASSAAHSGSPARQPRQRSSTNGDDLLSAHAAP